jgi:tRNA A-37 threonylcarbamoyl transferase component Bud32
MEPLAPESLVVDLSDLSTGALGPGTRLGRYEVLLPIASGGMARVWAARLHGQRGFSKLVAIKTMLPHLADSTQFERMFLDEARIASGVHHPNVTEIYELGEEGHVLYLAMEWVNGASLVHVVRGLHGRDLQPVEPRVAARIVAEACAGLHSAHELTDDHGPLEVVHRDISPHNILVSLEGTVKVTDFGVAKALGQSHQATATGHVKGKVAYMAPEILGADAFDRRSDIFAMGCVLYETVTGRAPFRGRNDPQVMQAILKGTYEPAPSVVPGLPLALTAVIDRALAADPDERFATAEQMALALEEWLAASGPRVTPAHVGGLVRRRLGAHLDERRGQIRAAMAAAPEPESADGVTERARTSSAPPGRMRASSVPPPPSAAGPSHSGVVATLPGADGAPGLVLTTDPSAAAVAPTRMDVKRMAKPPAERAAISSARYAVAAVAGVVFAMVVSAAAVAVWRRAIPRASPSDVGVVAPSQPAAAAAQVSPPAPAESVPVAIPVTPSTPLEAADSPTPKSVRTDPPSPPGRWALPAASKKAPTLPANPY